jgi:hypothetical protein
MLRGKMARNQWNQTHVPFKDWGQIVATLCCAKGETREVLREKHAEEPAKLDVRHDPWMSVTDAWSLLLISSKFWRK